MGGLPLNVVKELLAWFMLAGGLWACFVFGSVYLPPWHKLGSKLKSRKRQEKLLELLPQPGVPFVPYDAARMYGWTSNCSDDARRWNDRIMVARVNLTAREIQAAAYGTETDPVEVAQVEAAIATDDWPFDGVERQTKEEWLAEEARREDEDGTA